MLNKRNIIVTLWMLSILTCASYLITSVTIDTSLISIFSNKSSDKSSDNHGQAFKPSLFSSKNRLVFGSIQGTNEQKLAEYSKLLIKTLSEDTQFDFVTNGGSLPNTRSGSPLFSYRYLLSKYTEANTFSVAHIRDSFLSVQKTLRSPFSFADQNILSSDPTGNWKTYLKSYMAKSQPDRHRGVWFSSDKKRTLFLLVMSKNSSHIEHNEKQVNLIHKTFQNIISNKDSGATLTLSGPLIFSINSRNTIRAETQNLSILATVAVIVILLFAYRSFRLVLLSTIPVATAILIAATSVGLYFGSIHGITLAFGATLLGVVIDYPIHLFSHIRKNKTITQSVEYCWPTIRLGMITTVIAYSAMALADFAGLAQLGIFAMTGIIAGAMTTRWVVPVLISKQMNTKPLPTTGTLTKQLSNPPIGFTIVILGISILIISFVFLNNQEDIWQTDLRQFSSVPESSIKQFTNLKNDLHIPDSADMILVSADNSEISLQKTEDLSKELTKLIKSNKLQSFDAASEYLPSIKTQVKRQNSLPDSKALNSIINQAIVGMSIKKSYFDPFRDGVVSSKNIKPLTPFNPLAQTGSLLGNKLSSLLFRQGEKWISVIPLNGVNNKSLIQQTISRLDTTDSAKIQYINSNNELSLLMDQYLSETVKRIIIGSGILFLILGIGLSSLRQFVRVIFPISLGITVTTSILILTSGGLSIFHIVALLLTVGISIDYALFLSRNTYNLHDKQDTLTSIIICAVSTITVFGILGSSEIPVLQAIGKTVSIGVVVAFVLSFLLSQPPSKIEND